MPIVLVALGFLRSWTDSGMHFAVGVAVFAIEAAASAASVVSVALLVEVGSPLPSALCLCVPAVLVFQC